MSEDMPERTSDRLSGDMQRMSDRLSEEMSERLSQNVPARLAETMAEEMPERMSEEVPERMSEIMSEEVPERMSETMSEEMPEKMSERLSDMPERMPRYAKNWSAKGLKSNLDIQLLRLFVLHLLGASPDYVAQPEGMPWSIVIGRALG